MGSEDRIGRAALDTSWGASLAVTVAGRAVGFANSGLQGRRSDRELVPWILDSLGSVGVALSDIPAWIVGLGPGSFSGLRAGIAFLQGVRAGSGCELQGMASSVALAYPERHAVAVGGRIAVLHDGRRGQVIVSEYEWDGLTLGAVGGSFALDGSELPARWPSWARVVTAQADELACVVPEELADSLVCRQAVCARELLGAVSGRGAGLVTDDLEPVYVRPAVFVAPSAVRDL